MTRAELLVALMAERYDNRWWTTPAPEEPAQADNDLATARRRRALKAETTTHRTTA